MLKFILGLIESKLMQQIREHILFMSCSKGLNWGHPDQHCDKLGIKKLQVFGFVLYYICLGNFPHLGIEDFGKVLLEVLKQVNEKGCAACDIDFT